MSVGAVALSCGCTALVDTDADQCATADDCERLGPEFSGYVCSDRVCMPPSAVACTSSQECIDLLGRPAVCNSNGCVALTSEDCQKVVPEEAIGNDSSIFFGWMGPLMGDYESIGVPMQQAVELALREIQDRANGIPGGPGGGRRKLGLIACHSLDDPMRAAGHLINDVQVPGIYGPAFSGVTLSVATDIAIPTGTLLLSASATSTDISKLQDNDLVWRTVPSDAIQAIPLVELVRQAEVRIRTDQELAPTDQIRVATSSKGDAYGQGLFDAVSAILIFNDKSVTDNEDNFLATSYDDPSSTTVDFTPVVAAIVEFEPHIVLPLGTTEGVTDIMQGVEDAWPTTFPVVPKPYYLFPDGGMVDELLAATQDNEDLRLRIKGTAAGHGSQYDAFTIRYHQAYGGSGDAPIYTDTSYDAGYLMAYAVVAAGQGPVTGAHIASGLQKLSEGALIEVGPNSINDALNALSGGGAINFEGASGPLDFDNSLGEAEAKINIWCVQLNTSLETVFRESGQYYDPEAAQVVGTDTCDWQ